ncbi:MAG: RdgB/HAM1 family non-canonical purine NTP pyrophosphatase [Candidatus Izemoplasmatales bacterium]
MKEILIASTNTGKINEYKNALKKYRLKSILDLGINLEIEENGSTFEENAFIKAKTLYDLYQQPVLADDSGLIVEALPNELGVKSKRFSKSETDNDNIKLLLRKLKEKANRKAYFTTVICFYINPQDVRLFEGKTYGTIISSKRGLNGFGYDPIFLVAGLDKTYAELNLDEKHQFSHRGKAIDQLIRNLENENPTF